MLPNANKTHYNLRLSNMVQHTSFTNGKNSHIRKKMHQSLPEHLQIRTQRIQKIFGCLYPNDAYFKNALLTGYIPPPETFLYLNERNYLQDQNNIPITYHMQRKIGMKSIQYEEILDGRTADTRWRYMALPQKDTEDKHRKNTKKYWWIWNP